MRGAVVEHHPGCSAICNPLIDHRIARRADRSPPAKETVVTLATQLAGKYIVRCSTVRPRRDDEHADRRLEFGSSEEDYELIEQARRRSSTVRSGTRSPSRPPSPSTKRGVAGATSTPVNRAATPAPSTG